MRLGLVRLAYRLNRRKTLREMAASIGTSAATLSRIERGLMPDAKTLTRILAWLREEVVSE